MTSLNNVCTGSFKLVTEDVNFGGTHKVGCIKACYKDLANLFGEPQECDGYKVSGEWSFVGDNSELITVYDYKSTNLCGECDLTVEEFRNLESAEFSVGGHSEQDAVKFNEWLQPQLQGKVYSFTTLGDYMNKYKQLMNSYDKNGQHPFMDLVDKIY